MRLAAALVTILTFAAPLASRAQTPPDPGRAVLDRLYDDLLHAQDEDEARVIEQRLQTAWMKGATPATTLMVARGARELQANQDGEALDDLSAALDLQQDVAEIWRLRGLARARTGNAPGAIADIAETLKRDPNDYAAYQDLSRLAEQRGDAKGAFEAWQRAMVLDPKMPEGQARLNELRRRAFGERT